MEHCAFKIRLIIALAYVYCKTSHVGSEIIASHLALKLSLSFYLHEIFFLVLEEEEFGEFGQRVFIGMQ